MHTKRRNKLTHAHVDKLVYIHTNHRLIKHIKEKGLCLMEVTLDIIDKEGDDDRLLTMQNEGMLMMGENDEVHEDNPDNVEDVIGDEMHF